MRKKAITYAQGFASDGEALDVSGSAKIDVDGVVDLYESYIIPLTKEVEVSTYYLLSGMISAELGACTSGGLSAAAIGWTDTGGD